MSLGYRMLESLGGLKAAGFLFSEPAVLMYHRFGGDRDTRGAVPVDVLEAQLAILRERHHVLTASAYVRLRGEGRLPGDAVALTVDDGYEDVHTHLLPLLRKYALPATLFVVTEFIDGALWLWPDKVAYILEQTKEPQFDPPTPIGEKSYPLGNARQRKRAWNDFADWCLELHPVERDKVIADLALQLGVELPERAPERVRALTWDQVRELQAHGIEIGSHTCTHPRLVKLGADELAREVRESKARLEQQLQTEVRSFAYPHGQNVDVSGAVCDAVRTAGYRAAFTSYPESQALHHPYLWPRFSAMPMVGHFQGVLAGIEPLRARWGRRVAPPEGIAGR